MDKSGSKSKKTMIMGATTNPNRFAYAAAERLQRYGHEFVPMGLAKGYVLDRKIINAHELIPDIDTITLYVGPQNQPALYDYILSLKPRRVIFNPGTENEELMELLEKNNIRPVVGCTLVMLSAGTF